MCIGISADDRATATVTHCGRAGSWTYDPASKRLKHSGANGKCLGIVRTEDNQIPRAQLVKCDPNDLGKTTILTMMMIEKKATIRFTLAEWEKKLQ